VAAGVVVTLAVVLAPGPGHTGDGVAPPWSSRPVVPAVAPSSGPPDWVALAKVLTPAVVNISTKRTPPAGSELPDRSLGSGFVIHPDGDIVTNNHVVDGATEIRVKLGDGRVLPAEVIGRDSRTDLALLKVEAANLPVVPAGDSSALRVGEPVMAIGNPFGLEQTVTTGIVSATGRVIGEGPYDDFIQTDASINPGNSGGPLINARGQAVGINTVIFTSSGGSMGIGFAIPSNVAMSVVTQLARTGHVVRGWLGVGVQPLTPELARSFDLPDDRGALVSTVVDGSPAMKAGVRTGDVIIAYDGRAVARSEELPRAVADTPVGRQVSVTVVRQGASRTLRVTIARLAEPSREAAVAPAAARRLGLSLQTLTGARARELGLDVRRGVLVRDVEEGSRAAGAGVQPGDVIVEVDHRPVAMATEVRQLVGAHPESTPLLLLVHRKGGSLFLTVAG
jgi:serine protease Do